VSGVITDIVLDVDPGLIDSPTIITYLYIDIKRERIKNLSL
jgi:hypothetical protein